MMPRPKPITFAVNADGCYEVVSHKSNNGRYCQIRVGGPKKQIHRHIYEECFGPIPDDLFVCHKCDNTLCINPEHFFLGTALDNMHDKVMKNRQAKGEKSGLAKLNREQVIEIQNRYKRGNRKDGARPLGREYGVSDTAIRCILHGLSWNWLKEGK